jgi:hypothetical protein
LYKLISVADTINKVRFLVSVGEVGRYQKSIFGRGCLCEPIQIIIPNFEPTMHEAKKISQSRPILIPTRARPYPYAGSLSSLTLSSSMGTMWCSYAAYSGTSVAATPSLSTEDPPSTVAAPPSPGWTTADSTRCQARRWLPSPLAIPFLEDLPHHPHVG